MELKNTTEITSGVCGQNVHWNIVQENEDVILTLYGFGYMSDYSAAGISFDGVCIGVTKIIVKPGVTSIGNYAFAEFKELTSVELPSTVEFIGNYAFSSCTALAKISLPEGLRIIGPKAFEKCTVLHSISFPSTLAAIDFKAFKFSDFPKQIYYAGTEQQWERQVRVSRSSHGNKSIFDAEFTYAKTTKRYDTMIAKLAEVIENGGDGHFYIVTPDLTVEDASDKSGDCALLVFPNGHTMMIDAGAPSSECVVMTFIKKLGLRRLDSFVLSHPHGDHLGNTLAVAKYLCEEMGGAVGAYYYSGLDFKTAEKGLTAYFSEHGTELHRNMHAGDRLNIGGVDIEFFNPGEDELILKEFGDGAVNNVSSVIKFTYGASSYITAGDLYADKEAILAAKYGSALRADIAKTNHHGIFTSNTDVWYDAIKPKILISECDDIVCTLLSEKFAAKNIEHLKVSERGLVVISIKKDAGYHVETEFKI